MSRRKLDSPSKETQTQRKHVDNLDTINNVKTTVTMPKKIKKAIDVYAVNQGLFKKEVWIKVIEAGTRQLNIPTNLN